MNNETPELSIEDKKKKLTQLLQKQKEFEKVKQLYAAAFNDIAAKAIQYNAKQKTAKTKLKVEYYNNKIKKIRKEVVGLSLNLDFAEKALQNIQTGIDSLNKELPIQIGS